MDRTAAAGGERLERRRAVLLGADARLRADPAGVGAPRDAQEDLGADRRLGAFIVKFGAIIFKLKIFTVAGSMIVSVGAYALLGGWWFGLGLVLLIFVHEMGHVLELRRQGVPASAPLFIPFMGAFVGMKQMPENAWKEAQVALAGPLLGTLGAAAVWGLGVVYDSNFLRAMAFIGFLINLFNLLPVVPARRRPRGGGAPPALWAVGLAGLDRARDLSGRTRSC